MPTYQSGYFYTVNIYELIDDNLGSGNSGVETTDAVDENGWAPVYSMDANPITGSRVWLSADNGKQVNVKHQLRYDIKVWKASAGGLGPNAVGILGAEDGVKVVVLQSWVDTIAAYASVPKSFGNYVRQSKAVSGHGNTLFRFYVKATDKGVITPKIKVTLEGASQENPANPEPVEIALGSSASPVPMKTINFTKAKTEPKIPPGLKELVGADRARWNPCTNEWVGFYLTNVAGGKVDTTLVYYSKEGKKLRERYLGREAIDATGPNTFFGDAQEALLEAVRAVCGEVTPPAPDIGSPSVPPDPDKVRYNPPNHFVTRSVSHGERTREELTKNNSIVVSVVDAQNALTNRNSRLGKIYQSEDGAAALNKPVKGQVSLWGFRFTYNPQDINYSTSTNTSIDWMLNSKDPANLLGGNTTVNIKLYLNRIADMTELRKVNGGDFSKAYPRALRKEEIDGILYRGTEYDLEFLYRVLNGDPGKTALLEYDGKTSDWGYITGTPCWFHLHNNMRYYGSMASLSVNHVMFTQEMVPMLSVIDLSFIRYPSLELSPDKVREEYQSRATKIGSTGEEAQAK